MVSEDEVEKKAKEIFEREKNPGETWETVTTPREVGLDISVSSIGDKRRNEYRAKAREELSRN